MHVFAVGIPLELVWGYRWNSVGIPLELRWNSTVHFGRWICVGIALELCFMRVALDWRWNPVWVGGDPWVCICVRVQWGGGGTRNALGDNVALSST